MAFDDEHKKCMIATLATVEASNDYGIITAPDTLSLGIGQWTQGRAYDLLSKFSSGTSFGSTVDGWMSQGRDSWTISSRKYQYLSGADADALSSALDSDEGHRIQNKQMQDDLENDYIPRCAELGMDPESETEACMMLIVVMHRWGNYASILGRLERGAGHPATLDSMSDAIKYEGEWYAVGQRYEIAYDMIANLKTNGVELNPGESGGDNNGAAGKNKGKKDAEDAKKVKYIRASGDGSLAIYMADGSIGRAYLSGDGYYRASTSSQKGSGKKEESGSGGGGGGGGATADGIKAMTQKAVESIGQFVYHQWYEARLHPDQTGVTDCSGFCWWLYKTCCDIDIGPGGTSEIFGNQGSGWVVAEGEGSFSAADQVREGDLVVCLWYSGGGHIEYCTGGDGGWESIGARGPDGHSEPRYGSLSMFSGCSWELRRYIK